MTIRTLLIISLIFAPISLAACSHMGTPPIDCPGTIPHARRLAVKPLYQSAFGNGPAALTMVLNYHGVNISLEKTTAALLSNSMDATPVADMRDYASSYYSSVRVENSSVCDVVESISRENPVILLVDFGNTLTVTPRYIVVVGYNSSNRTLLFHTGYSEYLGATYEVIHEKWVKMGSLAIFIDRQ